MSSVCFVVHIIAHFTTVCTHQAQQLPANKFLMKKITSCKINNHPHAAQSALHWLVYRVSFDVHSYYCESLLQSIVSVSICSIPMNIEFPLPTLAGDNVDVT